MSVVSRLCSGQTRSHRHALGVKLACALFLAMLLASVSSSVTAYDGPKNLRKGWDGDVQMGALATFGAIDSSAISARATVSYRSTRWEHELDAKYYQSASEALVLRLDEDGQVMRDANDGEIKDLVSNTTNNRRFITTQQRWFFSSKHFLFGIADYDVNTPKALRGASRQIAGVGYKLYRSKHDLISAGLGLGRKKRVDVNGNVEEGAIAYLGFRIRRQLSDKVSVSFDLDSDFGSDNRYSEADVSLSWKLRDPLSLKLRYEARMNSSVMDPLNTFDDELEAALSVSLAVELF